MQREIKLMLYIMALSLVAVALSGFMLLRAFMVGQGINSIALGVSFLAILGAGYFAHQLLFADPG